MRDIGLHTCVVRTGHTHDTLKSRSIRGSAALGGATGRAQNLCSSSLCSQHYQIARDGLRSRWSFIPRPSQRYSETSPQQEWRVAELFAAPLSHSHCEMERGSIGREKKYIYVGLLRGDASVTGTTLVWHIGMVKSQAEGNIVNGAERGLCEMMETLRTAEPHRNARCISYCGSVIR